MSRFLALLASLAILAASPEASAVCRINRVAPTGTLQATPHTRAAQAFRFSATDDCVTLTFTSGSFTATPVMGPPRGAMSHLYRVAVGDSDWATLTASAITFTWTITGADAVGNESEVTTTNELDLDCDGVTRSAGDCDDANPLIEGPVVWYEDSDGDGDGNPGVFVFDCSAPLDGWVDFAADCDDTDPNVNFLAKEDCDNGVDDDCDGATDECLDEPLFAIEGSEVSSGLGSNVAVADFDGDGDADLLVGAPLLGDPNDYGQANVFYGPLTGAQGIDGGYVVLESGSSTEMLGSSVAGSDLDGDGYDDLVLGAAGGSRAYTFWGPLLQAFVFPTFGTFQEPAAVLYGATSTGTDVDVVPDMDEDGVCDIVIGAAGGGLGANEGETYVVSCDTEGSVDLPTEAAFTFYGDTDGTVGYANTSVGDQNGDGITDLVFGDSRSAVYVVNGGWPAGSYEVNGPADATIGRFLSGTTIDGEFGKNVVAADWNDDGATDLLVGAPGAHSSTGETSGLVYAFLGPFDDLVDLTEAEVVWESGDGAGLGEGGIAADDVDGDGYVDVFLGAPGEGAVYVQRDDNNGRLDVRDVATRIPAGSSGGHAGSAIALIPDWDGDGQSEIAIGATDASTSAGVDGGQVYVVASGTVF